MLTAWLDLPPLGHRTDIGCLLWADRHLTAPGLLSLVNAPPSGEAAGYGDAILHHGQYAVRVDDRVPRRWCLGILSHCRAGCAARTRGDRGCAGTGQCRSVGSHSTT